MLNEKIIYANDNFKNIIINYNIIQKKYAKYLYDILN